MGATREFFFDQYNSWLQNKYITRFIEYSELYPNNPFNLQLMSISGDFFHLITGEYNVGLSGQEFWKTIE